MHSNSNNTQANALKQHLLYPIRSNHPHHLLLSTKYFLLNNIPMSSFQTSRENRLPAQQNSRPGQARRGRAPGENETPAHSSNAVRVRDGNLNPHRIFNKRRPSPSPPPVPAIRNIQPRPSASSSSRHQQFSASGDVVPIRNGSITDATTSDYSCQN